MLSKSQYVSTRAKNKQDQIQGPLPPVIVLTEMRVSDEKLQADQSQRSLHVEEIEPVQGTMKTNVGLK
jgi:hypothetical protein